MRKPFFVSTGCRGEVNGAASQNKGQRREIQNRRGCRCDDTTGNDDRRASSGGTTAPSSLFSLMVRIVPIVPGGVLARHRPPAA